MKKLLLVSFLTTMVLAGCTDKSDLYDGDYGKEKPLPTDEYFDFKTTGTVDLSLDYGVEGYKFAFAVYAEDPIASAESEESYQLKDIEPLLSAYTDENSKFAGKLYLPTYLEKVYVFTSILGHYNVLELPVTATGVSYVASSAETKSTRAAGDFTFGVSGAAGTDANPYNISDKLGKWDVSGLTAAIYVDQDAAENDASLVTRLNSKIAKDNNNYHPGSSAMAGYDNTRYAKGKEYTNITTAQPLLFNDRTQQWEGGTKIELHFLWEWAGFHSALGYYYYPKGKVFTEADFKALPKYVAFPNCTWDEVLAGNSRAGADNRRDENGIPLQRGSTVKLLYFGDDYNQEGTEDFPEDITVGWFFMADAFTTYNYSAGGKNFVPGDMNGYVYDHANGKKNHYTTKGSGTTNVSQGIQKYNYPYIFTNEEFNKKEYKGCIALYEQTSGRIVMGFEDGDKNSYCDCLFYVKTNPGVINPGWDEIPDPEFKPVTTTYKGAIAFEDLWPKKGDYDMNDVIVNYESSITTDDKNNIQKIVDKFTTVYDGADYVNGFGYELGIPQNMIGSVEVDRQGVAASYETNAKGLESSEVEKSVVMLYDNHKQAINKPITVTTTIAEGKAFKTDYMSYMPPYNPFIIAKSNENKGQGRLEVHLPKMYKPTSLAGGLGTEDDRSTANCWYVSNPDADGIQYPFAIAIAFTDDYTSFTPAAETVKISAFYTQFTDWVKTGGNKNKDWYKYPAEK